MAVLHDNVPVTIACIVSDMFMENAFVISVDGNKDCLVVDPSFDSVRLKQQIEGDALNPVAILNTHGHSDHIAGNSAMKDAFPSAELVIGEKDAFKLTDPVANLSAQYGIHITSPPADRTLAHGDLVSLAGIEWEVRLTPGHSIGHIVLVAHKTSPKLVINGDVLFRESIGRTDFDDGSFPDLERSIREQLYTLPDDTVVLTGHGEPTTIGHEKRYNPFVNCNSD